MLVKELIQLLQKVDKDLSIYVKDSMKDVELCLSGVGLKKETCLDLGFDDEESSEYVIFYQD